MYRFLTPFLCLLLSALLVGCLSAPLAAETESGPVPELIMVSSADSFWGGVSFLALSEDGNTFVAGSENDGVGLYRTSDYAPLERYYACEHAAATPDKAESCKAKAYMRGAGYIDANTWYFAGEVLGKVREENKHSIRVRSIHPSREIAVPDIKGSNGARTFPANKDYLLWGSLLIDWRSGKRYTFNIPLHDPRYSPVLILTPDNRVITHTDQYVIIDPIHDTMEYWKEAGGTIMITSDNRHAIGISKANYKCTLWSWPERKKIGHCSERLGIFERRYSDYGEALALSNNGKFFAIGVDNDVRVYRIEPFKIELKVNMPGPVGALALSDDGWLAAYDYKGFLRIWNVATGSLAGQRSFFDGKTIHGAYAPKLAFQPGSGGRLFTTYKNMTVFEAPKQTAQQKTESASGAQKE
ncbi:MAG: hypothetical protein LBI92_10575 [Azoarcus sp.]|jgi:WD40 repeat protein|nr:hypothetical protein [Azoarcus sp.]